MKGQKYDVILAIPNDQKLKKCVLVQDLDRLVANNRKLRNQRHIRPSQKPVVRHVQVEWQVFRDTGNTEKSLKFRTKRKNAENTVLLI